MTTPPLDAIREALAALVPSRAGGVQERLAGLAVLGQVRALVDAVCVQAAGELEADARVPGPDNPVSAGGHASATSLLTEVWGVSVATAGMFCRVGEATQARTSLTGEALPARFEQAGDAVQAGSVSVEKAAVIVRELEKAAVACSAEALAAGEHVLVGFAPGYSVRELRGLAAQVRDRLDQDGVEPREVRQRRRRSLRVTTTEDAMVRIDALLDPESAAPVVAAIDAIVTRDLHTRRKVAFRDDHDGPTHDSDEDTRTLAQLRADALVELCRHAAGCTQARAEGIPEITVVVRIDLDTLTTGLGVGEIDGIRTPVSARTVRRMAADANLIPMVLGGKGEVLDLGRGTRLFTKAQRLALAERDGGCAWMGCPYPPSYTEAHHIRWWNAHSGPTDLDNGILLCSSHHHRIHDDGWDIQVRENVPYFIPPATVDPYRRPRPGGRVRLPAA